MLLGQAEDGGDLPQVGVQPLGGDVQVDAAVLGGHREAGLGAEERLVLHAEDVLAGDDDVGPLRGLVGVAADDRLAVDDVRVRDVADVVVVAVLVDAGARPGAVAEASSVTTGSSRVVDLDLGGGAARGLRVVGGDEGDRLAVVADLAVGEDRGVLDLQAVVLHLGRQVVVGQDGVHAGLWRAPREVSMETISAWATVERRVWPHSMSSCHMSEEYANSPVTLRVPSGRSVDSPMPPLVAEPWVRLARGAGGRAAHRLRPPLPGGRPRGGPRRGSSRSRCSGTGCRTAPRGCPRRSGDGLRSSSSSAATSRPGVQKPHWTAPASMNACWTGRVRRPRRSASRALAGSACHRLASSSAGAAGAGGAAAALGALPGEVGEALDGDDLAALGLAGRDQAGADRHAVQADRAGAALALLAGVLGAGQAHPLAQHVQQALALPDVVGLLRGGR